MTDSQHAFIRGIGVNNDMGSIVFSPDLNHMLAIKPINREKDDVAILTLYIPDTSMRIYLEKRLNQTLQ
jgi:hypothetical protein